MKNLIYTSIALCFFCTLGFGQTSKTTFRLLVGGNYIAKTTFRNEVFSGMPTTEYHEKGDFGMSFQAFASIYISKKWRFNTGLLMDKKGYSVKSIIAPADFPYPYSYKVAAHYFGIPLEIERIIFKSKTLSLSIDVGLAEQWKISSVGNNEYFSNNQFTFLGGLNFSVPFNHIAFITHPVFRYSPTQLEGPIIGGVSPSFNAYSVGLELGISF